MAVKSLLYDENDKGYEKYHANQAGPKPVKPFPEEDEFKIRQLKMGVHIFKLCNLFVLIKCLIPFGFIHRWECAHYRCPFSDREPGTRKSGDAAEQHL